MSAAAWLVLVLMANQQIAFGEVKQELKSIVALVNSSVVFTCSSVASSTENVFAVLHNANSTISSDTCEFSSDGSDFQKNVTGFNAQVSGHSVTLDGETTYTFDIEIQAVWSNNGSIVTCRFMSKKTLGHLYVAASEDLGNSDGFKNPIIISNTTTITVSWTPPWSNPINNYTVTIFNRSNSLWTVHNVEKNVSWNIQNNINTLNVCYEFDIYITVHTDIGIAKSNIIRTGLSKVIEPLQVEDISINILTKQSGGLKIEVTLKAIEYCSSVQLILYNYTIINNDQPVSTYGPIDDNQIDFENLDKNINYVLQVKYWERDKQSEATLITKPFVTSVMNQTNCSEPQPLSQDGGIEGNVMLVSTIVTGVLLMITIMVLIIIAIVCIARRRINKNRKRIMIFDNNAQTNDTFDVPPLPRERSKTVFSRPTIKAESRLVPQTMATNPLYEGTATLYSYLADSRDIKTLDLGKSNNNNISEIYAEIPLQVPLPIKESLDSPGLKTGVQLTLDKHTSNDQYVQMSSNSSGDHQRYIHSPVLNKRKGIKAEEKKVNGTCLQFEKEKE